MNIKKRFEAVRVPKPVSRPVRMRLRRLLELLAWALLDPVEDAPKVVAVFASICSRIAKGVRMEIVADINARIAELKQSQDHDDLVAAAELEDLVADIGAPLEKEDDTGEQD